MIPDFYGSVTKPPLQEGLSRIHDQVQQGSLAAMQPTVVQVGATLLWAARRLVAIGLPFLVCVCRRGVRKPQADIFSTDFCPC